ncbi:hypothetical protein GCM10009820_08950 [Leifsonia soli]
MPNPVIPKAIQKAFAELKQAAEEQGKGTDFVVAILRELADVVMASTRIAHPAAPESDDPRSV